MVNVSIDQVTEIIKEVANDKILPRFRNLKDEDIDFKIGDDPVTIADREAESVLSERLSGLIPGSKVLGEEAFHVNKGILEHLFGESPVWIIDPIDGTRNFTAGNPEFGVIVSLSQHNHTLAGWIYDPTSGDVITAEKGAGAWFKGQRQKTLPPKPLNEMFGFLGDLIIEDLDTVLNNLAQAPQFGEMTASSHEYPRLVTEAPHFNKAKPQAHFRATKYYATPWDDAAGVLIHNESGGYAAKWNGEPYRPSDMHKGLALAPDKESWLELREWVSQFCEIDYKKA